LSAVWPSTRTKNKSSEAQVSVTPQSMYPKWEGQILALFTLAVSLFFGYELVFQYHIVPSGAYYRMINGLYIVWGGNFHLAAMSLYWSPLISLLSIPFAVLRDWWPPLVTEGFTGNILSALFATVGVYPLNRILWRFGFGRTSRILWPILYIANPLILIYSSNGMADASECAFILASADGLIEYLQTGRIAGIIRGGSWLAAAFMLRYESVPIGGLLGVGLAIAIWRKEHNVEKSIGIAIAYLFPAFAAGITWMLLNWMIKGNPLWFALSRYSNSAQIASGGYNTPQVMAADHNIRETLYQVAHFTDNFWPFLIVLAAVVIMQFRRNVNPVGLTLALGSLGAPLLQAALLYKHSSADWDRFFIYYIPFGILLSAFLVSRIASEKKRQYVAILSCAVLISANYVTWGALHNNVWGDGSVGYMSSIGQRLNPRANLGNKIVNAPAVFVNVYGTFAPLKAIAHYINSRPGIRVLVSADVMPWIKRPNQVVFTNEADFNSILLNPRGRVSDLLVSPVSILSMDTSAITHQYPTVYFGGVPWTKLIHQFPNGDRLYAVLPTAP